MGVFHGNFRHIILFSFYEFPMTTADLIKIEIKRRKTSRGTTNDDMAEAVAAIIDRRIGELRYEMRLMKHGPDE